MADITDIDESAGAPVVLVHGATASPRVWQHVVSLLTPEFRCLTPTLAGHLGGPELAVAPHQVVEGIVDALCRYLDAADIDTAHVVGNSLGGWVALELARRGRARSVLALSPAGAWVSRRDLARLLTGFRIGAALGRRKAIPKLAARNVRARRLLLRGMAEHPERMTPGQVLDAFADMAGCAVLGDLLAGASRTGRIRQFDALPCPGLIAWSGCDRTLPYRRYGAPMLAAVPGAELAFLPGVGHVPMIDDPALVAWTIAGFVSKVESAHSDRRPTNGELTG